MDNAIHRIKIYPVDGAIGFPNTYPLDSDLSGRQRYPTFEQSGPGRSAGSYRTDRSAPCATTPTTPPKGIIYFQAIQDAYAELPNSYKGSSMRTTFCVKTPQETYYVAAPCGLAMSIWIDAILTGREGPNFYN